MWFGVDGHDYISVNSSALEGFEELINYHAVNASLGCFCMAINTILLIVFMTTPKFRNRYVLLIQLCVADLINSIAIVMAGLNRIDLYSSALETKTLPVRTSTECAAEIWLILKLIGDLLIPVSIFWMGIERLTAIKYPLLYRTRFDGTYVKYLLIPILSVLFVIVPLIWAVLLVDSHNTMFTCGRKAAFGESFGTFIYISNILCNVVATCLNAAAFILATRIFRARMNRQVSIIRYYLIISILSTLLVSLPNSIALSQLYIHRIKDSVSKPAYFLASVNSGIHFFVYLCIVLFPMESFFLGLNKDFRSRTKELLSSSRKPKEQSEAESPLRANFRS